MPCWRIMAAVTSCAPQAKKPRLTAINDLKSLTSARGHVPAPHHLASWNRRHLYQLGNLARVLTTSETFGRAS
jgi:hypothetical protein